MPQRRPICIFTFILAISFLAPQLHAQTQKVKIPPKEEVVDSVPFFNGFAVSFDLVGAIQLAVSDYGQYEAALRVNLRDRYFPIIELGYGKASHDDEVTFMHYRSSAPYGRIGCDFNLMRDKHDLYRLYGGVRYAFTSFKFDLSHPDIEDPVYGGTAHYDLQDVKAHYHWIEAVAGVDATIWGPVHLGWSVRYRRKLSSDDSMVGNVWYVPGFGRRGGSRLGGTFNIIIDI